MFSPQLKSDIAAAVQEILQDVEHYELPEEGEISFILHIDGTFSGSYANIRNNGDRNQVIPIEICENLTK